MFLYLLTISLPFHLFRLLCLGWSFSRLEVCGSFLFWRSLPVGGVGVVACQGVLVSGACICVLVGGAWSFLLDCSEVSSVIFGVSMGLA